ncbi:hypothetical protein CR513_14152, partial [Mucuna pruriens]
MAVIPAAQPIPPRLKLWISCLSLKWFTIIDESDGVVFSIPQFTIRILISFGFTFVAARRAKNSFWQRSCQVNFPIRAIKTARRGGASNNKYKRLTELRKSGSLGRTLTEKEREPAFGPEFSTPLCTISVENSSLSFDMG